MAEKAAITRRFLQRKMDEYEAPKVEIEALKSGMGEGQGDGQKVQST